MKQERVIILAKKHVIEGEIKVGLELLSNCNLPLNGNEKCNFFMMAYNLNEKDSLKVEYENYQIKRNRIGEGDLGLVETLSKEDLINNKYKKSENFHISAFVNLGVGFLALVLIVINIIIISKPDNIPNHEGPSIKKIEGALKDKPYDKI